MSTSFYHATIKLALGNQKFNKALFEAKLRMIEGIKSAYVDQDYVLSLYADRKQALIKALTYTRSFNQEKTQSPIIKNNKEELKSYRNNAIISLVGFGVLEGLKRFAPTTFAQLSWVKSIFVLAIAKNILKSGIEGLVVDHRPNADTLTSTAVIASLLSGKPESSLSLLVLSNFAEMLTQSAAEKARVHISSLLGMKENFVWKLENGVVNKVPIEQININDQVVVHLGEKISVDGVVTLGQAAVDQAALTGEYIPAFKQKGDLVYAGTVVKTGEITIEVKKIGDETNLARIINMVENAQNRRAPIQNFADRMANMLVPISFISAGLVYLATRDLQRVLNMFFIDFSCGLKLSTSTAISAAISKSAQIGVLVKGGNFIETLADIDTVVFDKTGTITNGHPTVVEVIPSKTESQEEVILLAAAAERSSSHPLAESILSYAAKNNWEIPTRVEATTIVGRGISATVESFGSYQGGSVLVGSLSFMQENNVKGLKSLDLSEKIANSNLIYVAKNNKLAGVILISDPIRRDLKKTINRLRRLGIDEILMLTGDTQKTAEFVANKLDLDDYKSDILPQGKAEFVANLQRNSKVLMVGDGINDAPALAYADIGVALGGKSTDIALESADITITADEPLKLPAVIDLSKRTMTMVRQNFAATIAINATAMLLGALGKINPLLAATIHNASTIGVVLNSSRILFQKFNLKKEQKVIENESQETLLLENNIN